jgi:hypothetical protein
MYEFEVALPQGRTCIAGALKRAFPSLGVSVRSIIDLGGDLAYETLLIEGPDALKAAEFIRSKRDEERVTLLEEEEGRILVRVKIGSCPLLPMIRSGTFEPRFPFHVNAHTDLWRLPDEAGCRARFFKELEKADVMPRMVRRDTQMK